MSINPSASNESSDDTLNESADHANRHFRDLCEENAQLRSMIDILSGRMDALEITFNAFMGQQMQQATLLHASAPLLQHQRHEAVAASVTLNSTLTTPSKQCVNNFLTDSHSSQPAKLDVSLMSPSSYSSPSGDSGHGHSQLPDISGSECNGSSASSLTSSMCQLQTEMQDFYAWNRQRPETSCESISIEPFSIDDNSQDFNTWIRQFEDRINRGFNPHSEERHHRLCLQCLPGHLSSDAFAIWLRCKDKKDWTHVKEELRLAYDDPVFRMKWKTNPRAYIWDEQNESLSSYCSNVKHYVDNYETAIATIPEAVHTQYYTRFVSGLPDEYQDEVKRRMPSRKQDVDHALDICIRFQLVKRKMSHPNPQF